MLEEARERPVAREGEHHAGVGGQAEEAAMPDTEHDEGHQGNSAVLTEDVDKDL